VNTSNFGFLSIDKPRGLTSHDCVNRLRKIFEMKRIGHGGTLDPSVTGVLPIAIGKATRLLSFLPSSKKYEGTIKLGVTTNTDDLEGEVISEQPKPKIDNNSLVNLLNRFKGSINQYPPKFSSVHIAGERAYKKARRGEVFELTSKQITIHNIQLLRWDEITGEIDLSIHCSSGTYIRSLARDIGQMIGCGGVLAKLRRTEALGFDINKAIPLPKLSESKVTLKGNIINPMRMLTHLPSVQLKVGDETSFWCKGQSLIISKDRFSIARSSIINEQFPTHEFITVLNCDGGMEGIAIWDKDHLKIKPKIVFNAAG